VLGSQPQKHYRMLEDGGITTISGRAVKIYK